MKHVFFTGYIDIENIIKNNSASEKKQKIYLGKMTISSQETKTTWRN